MDYSALFTNVEFLGRILPFLDTHERIVLSRTSKPFYRACNDPNLWRSCDFASLALRGLGIDDRRVVCVLRAHKSIQRLNFRFCTRITKSSVIAVGALLGKNLQYLNLEGCYAAVSDPVLAKLTAKLPQLQSLILSGCRALTSRTLFTFLQAPRPLRHLALNGIVSQKGDDGVTDLLLQNLVRSNLQLHSLSLSGNRISDKGLVPLLAALAPHLRHLEVGYCQKLTDKSVAYAARCPNLNHLNLYGLYRVTDQGLRALASCRKLSYLDLSLLTQIRDEGVCALAEGCPSLSTLNLYNCGNLTDKSIVHVASRCRQLQVLCVYGITSLSSQTIRGLQQMKLRELDIGGR